jgi:hypothetical protein
VLDVGTAEQYTFPGFEHGASLLFDLGGLKELGEAADSGEADTGRVLEFARAHGLLWHGPGQVGKGDVRESLRDWFIAGLKMSISLATYTAIRRSQEEDSGEPLRSYLRDLRVGDFFKRIAIPDDDNELLRWASIQLAELVSRGMADCTPTLSAACGLLKDGKPAGPAGDFRLGNDPGSLVGAANYQLARLVSRKALVRECGECGEMFLPNDPRQREHKKCGNRRRKRESRQR